MKKLTVLLSMIALAGLIFTACEGPAGPQGPTNLAPGMAYAFAMLEPGAIESNYFNSNGIGLIRTYTLGGIPQTVDLTGWAIAKGQIVTIGTVHLRLPNLMGDRPRDLTGSYPVVYYIIKLPATA